MTFQELVDKAKSSELSGAEKQELLRLLDSDFQKLKEENPSEYIKFLESVQSLIAETNSKLKQINSSPK